MGLVMTVVPILSIAIRSIAAFSRDQSVIACGVCLVVTGVTIRVHKRGVIGVLFPRNVDTILTFLDMNIQDVSDALNNFVWQSVDTTTIMSVPCRQLISPFLGMLLF